MLCIYNIIHVSFFFLTHVPGRLAVMLRVYCVKIVSTSAYTSLAMPLCTQVCLYTVPRA